MINMADYTAEFNEFWTLYGAPKNASKADAFKAWGQKSKSRPRQELLLASVQAYNIWLSEEHSRNGNGYPSKAHPATWIRGERWEGFLDQAEAILQAQKGHLQAQIADQSAASRSWLDGPWNTLKSVLLANGEINPGPVYEAWIRRTVFVESNPPEIRCSSEFLMAELEKRFGGVIRKAFPGARITVLGKTDPG